jgi:hypothetical protein
MIKNGLFIKTMDKCKLYHRRNKYKKELSYGINFEIAALVSSDVNFEATRYKNYDGSD